MHSEFKMICFRVSPEVAEAFESALERQWHLPKSKALLFADFMRAVTAAADEGKRIEWPLAFKTDAELTPIPVIGRKKNKTKADQSEQERSTALPEPKSKLAGAKPFAIEADPDDLVKGIWSKDGPMPTNREWRAFLEERYGIPEAPWDACRNYHAEFFAWRKERAEPTSKD